jgi:hypothetical protein
VRFFVVLVLFGGVAAACTREHPAAPPPPPASSSPAPPPPNRAASATSTAVSDADGGPLPSYLVRLATNGDLYAREGAKIVAAPAADIAVLRRYPEWKDKGALASTGERLTILAAKDVYAPNEEIRIVHVHEATKPGVELYVMGPKEIFGEYVDGALVSKAAAAPPGPYDGAVVPSPGEDHNYEVSVHRLAKGVHTIEWRFQTLSGNAPLRSNVLTIDVR